MFQELRNNCIYEHLTTKQYPVTSSNLESIASALCGVELSLEKKKTMTWFTWIKNWKNFETKVSKRKCDTIRRQNL